MKIRFTFYIIHMKYFVVSYGLTFTTYQSVFQPERVKESYIDLKLANYTSKKLLLFVGTLTWKSKYCKFELHVLWYIMGTLTNCICGIGIDT